MTAASYSGACCCLWRDLLNGVHQPDDVYKLSLHQSAKCDLDDYSETYSKMGEVSGQGYDQGGIVLKGRTVEYEAGVHGATLTFAAPKWPRATIDRADTVCVYNASKGNRTLLVQRIKPTSSTNGPFVLEDPVVIRVGAPEPT